MYLGNFMLLILNLPLIGIWVRIVLIPYVFLFPLVLFFCLVGSFSIAFSTLDIYAMSVFGVICYLMRKFGYEGAPLILAFILGPLMETSLRQSLIISHGNFSSFLTKPICVIALSIAAFLLVTNLSSHLKARRQERKTGPPL